MNEIYKRQDQKLRLQNSELRQAVGFDDPSFIWCSQKTALARPTPNALLTQPYSIQLHVPRHCYQSKRQ